mmetsp:Transcript_33050/g.85100  ORF Transcript_33050/g.85100 Transcript_33050/m.85100 type:complete len:229 (+) Transcript_33050:422-1108(+)
MRSELSLRSFRRQAPPWRHRGWGPAAPVAATWPCGRLCDAPPEAPPALPPGRPPGPSTRPRGPRRGAARPACAAGDPPPDLAAPRRRPLRMRGSRRRAALRRSLCWRWRRAGLSLRRASPSARNEAIYSGAAARAARARARRARPRAAGSRPPKLASASAPASPKQLRKQHEISRPPSPEVARSPSQQHCWSACSQDLRTGSATDCSGARWGARNRTARSPPTEPPPQ